MLAGVVINQEDLSHSERMVAVGEGEGEDVAVEGVGAEEIRRRSQIL